MSSMLTEVTEVSTIQFWCDEMIDVSCWLTMFDQKNTAYHLQEEVYFKWTEMGLYRRTNIWTIYYQYLCMLYIVYVHIVSCSLVWADRSASRTEAVHVGCMEAFDVYVAESVRAGTIGGSYEADARMSADTTRNRYVGRCPIQRGAVGSKLERRNIDLHR